MNKIASMFILLLFSNISFSSDFIIDYIYLKSLKYDSFPDKSIALLCNMYNKIGDEDKIIKLVNHIEANSSRVKVLNQLALYKDRNSKNGPLYNYLKELGNRSIVNSDYSVMVPLIKYFYWQDKIVFEKLIYNLFENVPSSKIAVLDRAFWAIDLLDLLKREKMYAYINSIYKIVEALLGDNAIASQDKYQVARKLFVFTNYLTISCPIVVENAIARMVDLNDTEEVLFVFECSSNLKTSSLEIFLNRYHEKLEYLFHKEELEDFLIYLSETKSDKTRIIESTIRSAIETKVEESLNQIIDYKNKDYEEIVILNIKMLLSMGYYDIAKKYTEAIYRKGITEKYKSAVDEHAWTAFICDNMNYYESYNYPSIIEELLIKDFNAELKIMIIKKILTNKDLTESDKDYITNSILKIVHREKSIDLKVYEKAIELFIEIDELSKGVKLLLETPKNELDKVAIKLSKKIIENYGKEALNKQLDHIKIHNDKIIPYILSTKASKLTSKKNKKEMEKLFIISVNLSEKNCWLYINEIIENYKMVFTKQQ